MRAPCRNGVGDVLELGVGHMPSLRIVADDQRQFDLLHLIQQPLTPERRTFAARWQVARAPCARKAKTHGQDGDARRVVERFAGDAHPLPQPLAAGVVERYPAFVHLAPGRLACNEDACLSVHLQHGPRPRG